MISERETWTDADGKARPALPWLLDVMVESLDPQGRARGHRVFRIVEPRVRERLGLPERDGFRYSLDELERGKAAIQKDLGEAESRRAKEAPLDSYDRELLKLGRSLRFHARIAAFADPHLVPPTASADAANRSRHSRSLITATRPDASRRPSASVKVRPSAGRIASVSK